MPIPLQRLREAAVQFARTKLMTLSESRQRFGKRTAFLCHSHHDTQLVEGLLVLLSANGFDVYVDWKDAELPDTQIGKLRTRSKTESRRSIGSCSLRPQIRRRRAGAPGKSAMPIARKRTRAS